MLEALRTKCGGSRITGLDWGKGLVLGCFRVAGFETAKSLATFRDFF